MSDPPSRHPVRSALGAFAIASLTAALVAVGPVGVTPSAQASPVRDRTSTAFVVRDRAIDENSALAFWRHRLLVTTNDSGDTGRLFLLGRSGRTVGVTRWMRHPVDCEALAPGKDPRHVWVGDIGDNAASRPFIRIAQVPVSRGHRTVHVAKYRLVYPDGAHNAETLLRNPATGRLYVATKEYPGGHLYAVPRKLSHRHPNVLKRIAPVLATATDGSFLPGGHFLVIRNYTRAAVYTWPSMRQVGALRLPAERQGEGLATDSKGSVLLSSEGVDQPVLRLRLPARVRTVVDASGRRALHHPRDR
jgi:hypothetical protein